MAPWPGGLPMTSRCGAARTGQRQRRAARAPHTQTTHNSGVRHSARARLRLRPLPAARAIWAAAQRARAPRARRGAKRRGSGAKARAGRDAREGGALHNVPRKAPCVRIARARTSKRYPSSSSVGPMARKAVK
jgi:hypothetical protein